MSFADPIVVTVNSVAKSLPRVNSGDAFASEYFLREALQEFRMKIRHSAYTPKGGVLTDRHNMEFTNTVYATSTTAALVRKTYVVFEHARSDTDAAVLQDANGFIAFTSSATIQKLLNQES